jgi:uncharacterized membrane protein
LDDIFLWYKAVHVVAAIMLMGPAFGYGVITYMGRQEPQHMGFVSKVLARLGRRRFQPGIAIVILTGILMGLNLGASYFQRGWLATSIVIVAVLVIYGFTFQRRDQKIVAEIAPQLRQAEGKPDPELIAALGKVRKRLKIAGNITAWGYGLVAALMVMRPF